MNLKTVFRFVAIGFSLFYIIIIMHCLPNPPKDASDSITITNILPNPLPIDHDLTITYDYKTEEPSKRLIWVRIYTHDGSEDLESEDIPYGLNSSASGCSWTIYAYEFGHIPFAVGEKYVIRLQLKMKEAYGGEYINCYDDEDVIVIGPTDPSRDLSIVFTGGSPPLTFTFDPTNPVLLVNIMAQIISNEPINDSFRIYFTLFDGINSASSNEVWYCLTSGGSGTIQFQSQVEWGGSLPSGNYTLQAHMNYNEVNCDEYGWNWWEWQETVDSDEKTITLTEAPDPSSGSPWMYIEYDHQEDYDVFEIPTAEKTLENAFNIANTGFDLLLDESHNSETGEQSLPNEEITWNDLNDYIQNQHYNHFDTHHMHFMVIQNAKNRDPWDYDALGYSIEGEYGFTVIFMQYIRDENTDMPIGYWDVITEKVMVHELGHHRGGEHGIVHASGDNADPVKHDSPYCVMNQGIFYQGNNDNDPNNDDYNPVRFFITNPHFCPSCVEKLMVIPTWGTGNIKANVGYSD
jgi:hypothetical protein